MDGDWTVGSGVGRPYAGLSRWVMIETLMTMLAMFLGWFLALVFVAAFLWVMFKVEERWFRWRRR